MKVIKAMKKIFHLLVVTICGVTNFLIPSAFAENTNPSLEEPLGKWEYQGEQCMKPDGSFSTDIKSTLIDEKINFISTDTLTQEEMSEVEGVNCKFVANVQYTLNGSSVSAVVTNIEMSLCLESLEEVLSASAKLKGEPDRPKGFYTTEYLKSVNSMFAGMKQSFTVKIHGNLLYVSDLRRRHPDGTPMTETPYHEYLTGLCKDDKPVIIYRKKQEQP